MAKKAATTKATTKATKSKKTRPQVFDQIMKKGGTKKELISRMNSLYGGSAAEAEFQTSTYLRLLLTMGYVKKDKDGIYTLIK